MIDKEINEIIELARKRGSQYVKREYSPEQFDEQMAELGIYLLSECCRIQAIGDKNKKIQKINELHQKIDNFRQAIFDFKRMIMK